VSLYRKRTPGQLTVLSSYVVDVVVQAWSHPTVNLVRSCHSLKRMLLLPASNNQKRYSQGTFMYTAEVK